MAQEARKYFNSRYVISIVWALCSVFILRSSPAFSRLEVANVSSKGADVAACGSVASPCRTVQFALDNITNKNGHVNIIDGGYFGSVVIKYSVKIYGVPGATIDQGSGGLSAITVNALPADSIVIQGLQIRGKSTASNGILILSGGVVTLRDCSIEGFAEAGLKVAPTLGALTLFGSGIAVINNSGAGILIDAASAAPVRGTIRNVEALNNRYGVYIAGSTNITMIDGVATTNGSGIVADGVNVNVSLIRVVSNYNNVGIENINGARISAIQTVASENKAFGVQNQDVTGSRFYAGLDNSFFANKIDVSGSRLPTLPAGNGSSGAGQGQIATAAAAKNEALTRSSGSTLARPAAVQSSLGAVHPRDGSDQNLYSLSDTWASASTTFAAIGLNVNDYGSRYNSNLLDVGVIGSNRVNIRKNGDVFIKNSAGNSLGGFGLRGGAGEMALTSQIDPNTGQPADVMRWYWESNLVGNVPGSAAVLRGMGRNRFSIESQATLVHIANNARFEWEGLGGVPRLSVVGYEAGSSIGRPIDFNNSGQSPIIETPLSVSTVDQNVDIAKFGTLDVSRSEWSTLAKFDGFGRLLLTPGANIGVNSPIIKLQNVNGSTTFQVTTEGAIQGSGLSLTNLPSADPHVAGQVWSAGGQLMVSGG